MKQNWLRDFLKTVAIRYRRPRRQYGHRTAAVDIDFPIDADDTDKIYRFEIGYEFEGPDPEVGLNHEDVTDFHILKVYELTPPGSRFECMNCRQPIVSDEIMEQHEIDTGHSVNNWVQSAVDTRELSESEANQIIGDKEERILEIAEQKIRERSDDGDDYDEPDYD